MTLPFISETDLRDFLEDDGVLTDDFTVIALDAACEAVRTFTNQHINYVEDDEVTLDARGRHVLLLPELPVWEVTAVEVDGTALTSTEWLLSSSGLLYRQSSTGAPPVIVDWPYGIANVTVTYSHGWSLDEPPPSGVDRVPSDLRHAALKIAARLYNEQGSTQGDIRSETIGDYSYTVSEGSSSVGGITDSEMLVLNKYVIRKVPVA